MFVIQGKSLININMCEVIERQSWKDIEVIYFGVQQGGFRFNFSNKEIADKMFVHLIDLIKCGNEYPIIDITEPKEVE